MMSANRHDMTQSGKADQAQGARRGRAAGAGEIALSEAAPAFARAGFSDASLLLRWPEIAGPEVARVARPLKLQEGADGAVLTLRCEPGSAVFLQHETRALIERVNAYLGHHRIARLRLVTGPGVGFAVPPCHPAAGRPQDGDSPAPVDLGDALARLDRRRHESRRK